MEYMEKEKICCFFGHRDAPEILFPAISAAVRDLVETEGVSVFLVGGHGNFDRLAAEAVASLRQEYPHIRLLLAAAYGSAVSKAGEGLDDRAFVPGELRGVPVKAAIPRRNRWMAAKSQYVIAFVERETGGAYGAVAYARRKGKKILLL